MTNASTIHQSLIDLGLTENAITLYLESYSGGRATVGRLAQQTGMDRSSAHLAADQLRAAGLLEEIADGGRTLVWVKAPQEILTRLRIRTRNLQSQSDVLEAAMPELEAGYTERESIPVLQVFSGKDGLRQVVANIFDRAEGEILLLTNQEAERQVFTRADHNDFIRNRKKRKLAIRVLAVSNSEGQELVASDTENLRETRLINDGQVAPFTTETYIYGDSVAVLSFSDVAMGFVVRSADYARAQRWMFERLWKELE